MFILLIVMFMNSQIQHESVLVGMGLGISTSPLMTYVIKRWKAKRKVDKMIRELRVLMNMRIEQEKIKREIDPENSMQKVNP